MIEEVSMQSRISLLRIAALALLVYALAMFTSAVRDVSYARQRLASQEAALCAAQRENLELKEKLEAVESGEGMEALARERLGLVMPGERIFYFTTDSAAADDARGETERVQDGT